jgi:hypothetical protein
MFDDQDPNQPIAYTDEGFAAVADVCKQRGVNFIGIFGISELLPVLRDLAGADDTPKVTDSKDKIDSYCKKHGMRTKEAEVVSKMTTTGQNTDRFIGIMKDGNLEKFKQLYEADHSIVNKISNPVALYRPIHTAAKHPQAIKILEFLLEHGADAECKTAAGKTPLEYAIRGPNLDGIKMLLRHGVKHEIQPQEFPESEIEKLRFIPELAHLKSLQIEIMRLLPECKKEWGCLWKLIEDEEKVKNASILSTGIVPDEMDIPVHEIHDNPPSDTNKFMPYMEDSCMACDNAVPDTIAIPCGHKVLCQACSKTLKESNTFATRHCVKCNQEITGVYLEKTDDMQ